jgi:hypothetical protein
MVPFTGPIRSVNEPFYIIWIGENFVNHNHLYGRALRRFGWGEKMWL